MEDSSDTLVRVRQEHMISPNGGKPTFRIAYFLPPSISPIHGNFHELPSLSSPSLPPTFQPQFWRLKLSFIGWKSKQEKWKAWVDRMITMHLSTWMKAGIHEAILSSTYTIRRDNDLVLGIAENWCSKTQSFIFPWGEATITLEDIMVLGGYSTLGDSVLRRIEQVELKETEEKLHVARLEFCKSKSKKPYLSLWMKTFMDSGSELEHEAFLAFWLSTFVFPFNDTVREQVFPLAVNLAKGSRIALAPAVLASIYRDLSLLKEMICALTSCENENVHVLDLKIRSPFHLLQTWVWERFLGLGPEPNVLEIGQPRLARWDNMESWKIENVRLALDSAEEIFQWRPYSKAISNWHLPKFNPDNEVFLPAGPASNEDLMSFARCLRVSELVGFDTVQQYLPHRVAMQFGMDQDLPSCVIPFNETPDVAWNHYNMHISNFQLYIPSRLFEADVTVRYLEWWKQSVLVQKEHRQLTRLQHRVSESSERPIKGVGEKGKRKSKVEEDSPCVKHLKGTKLHNLESKEVNEASAAAAALKTKSTESSNMRFSSNSSKRQKGKKGFAGVPPNSLEKSQQRSEGKVEGKIAHVPPSIPSNCAEVQASDSTEEAELKLTIAQVLESTTNNKNGQHRQATDPEKPAPCPFGSLSFSISNDVRKMGTKTRSLEDIVKTGAAMKAPKTQKSVENERLGEKESLVLEPPIASGREVKSRSFEFGRLLDLEDRISRLERVVAEIKAAKFGSRVDE